MDRDRKRPLIAFFDYPDVFEDFYPHYGIDQRTFATQWADTANHAFLALLQREVGDVVWYSFSIRPQIGELRHEKAGFRVKVLASSLMHRCLWKLFYLPRNAWKWRKLYPLYAGMASYSALLASPFLRALRRERPDFLFVQDYATGRFDVLILLARLFKIPLIAYHSGSRPEWYMGRWLKKHTLPQAACLLVSSRAEQDMLAQHFHVPREKLRVVLTPLDTDVYAPGDRVTACRELELDPGKHYLLFVGRLEDRVKRVGVLVRLFARLAPHYPDWDLLIAGDGPDCAVLQSLAAQIAPGRVRFLGWISDISQKAALYCSADCLVLPSRSEGFPTVVGEAMACGTPVLGSRVGGIPELVREGETGWLCDPQDDNQLEEKLEFVLAHPLQVAALRRKAREEADSRVSASAVAQQLKSCFAGESYE